MSTTLVIGDVHAQLYKLTMLLRAAELVDDQMAWIAGDTQLWFTGDFADRGPDTIGVLDLVMRLQQQAAETGGRVEALLGNHDALILAAARFGDRPSSGMGGTFIAEWELNGGRLDDLDRLTDAHLAWITCRPALALVAGRLLVHADSLFYFDYGNSIDAVNSGIRAVLEGDEHRVMNRLLARFSSRFAFDESHGGKLRAAQLMLERLGGNQIIHGHTPIPIMDRQPAERVTAPYTYAHGLAVNVDAGLFLGSKGFVYRLPDLSPGA